MTDTVTLRAHDETHDRVVADAGILQEIGDRFTFYAKNYKFHPKFRARAWDGKIRLMSPFNPYLLAGLRTELARFCEARGYDLRYEVDHADQDLPLEEARDFLDTLDLPTEMNGIPFAPRDYQVEAFSHAVRKRRCVLLCPTASGKSLIIYSLVRWYRDAKVLIVVPSLGLVNQMKGDFGDYGYDVSNVHQIFSGQEKVTDHHVTVSTWQSLRGASAEYLKRFDVLIVDEVHGAKAKELKETVERMTECSVRVGLSGTLDGSEANELTITGLFGPIRKVTTTRELMDSGKLARLTIKSIVLEHTEANKRMMSRAKYPDEMKYLIGSESRNRFIANLAMSLEGNTLVLYRYVDLHGEPLHALIASEAKCPVLYVSGKVEMEEREEIRKFVNSQTRSITVGSKGCVSTGTNIPNIDNIIFASPSKAQIETLQSIGRGLRMSDRKTTCTLFDVADDLSIGAWVNHTLNHYVERTRIYREEKFDHRAYPVKLKS